MGGGGRNEGKSSQPAEHHRNVTSGPAHSPERGSGPDTPEQVAYIKLVEGDVGYSRGDDSESQWNTASVNVPVMTGDSLYAIENGKAEVQISEGSFLRLGSGAYLAVLQNTTDRLQLKLTSGTATLRLVQLDRAYEIDTPSMAFTPRQPGEYRVDVNSSGDSEITLHEGEGVLSMAEGREESLAAPNWLRVLSTSSLAEQESYVSDAWDQWSRERDNLAFRSVSRQYMPPGIHGYDAMDGDPAGTGMGGPGYTFEDEIDPRVQFDRPGRLAMSNSGPNSNGSQFFITEAPAPQLNRGHTIFGQCDDATVEVVKSISRQPRDTSDIYRNKSRPH